MPSTASRDFWSCSIKGEDEVDGEVDGKVDGEDDGEVDGKVDGEVHCEVDYSVYSWPSFNQEWNQAMVGPCYDKARTRTWTRSLTTKKVTDL